MNVAEYEAMYRVEDTLWWYVGMRRIVERVIGPALRAGGLRILDAGCGTGGNLAWLGRFGTAYGIDLSPHALQFSRRRRLRRTARASVLDLPFPDRSFDLVTSFDVVYHLDVADDVGALREARRVLKPGGLLVVRVPAFELLRSGHDRAVHTRQRYTLAELERKLARAGLDVQRATYVNSLLFPLAVASRLAGRLRGGDQGGDHDVEEASDVHPVAAPLNATFTAIMKLEARLLAYADLPAGLSALAVARRPDSPEQGPVA